MLQAQPATVRKKTVLAVTEAAVSKEQMSKEEVHFGTWRILGAACVGSTGDTSGGKPSLTDFVCLLSVLCLPHMFGLPPCPEQGPAAQERWSN